MSNKRSAPGAIVKSFRIDDLLQRRTIKSDGSKSPLNLIPKKESRSNSSSYEISTTKSDQNRLSPRNIYSKKLKITHTLTANDKHDNNTPRGSSSSSITEEGSPSEVSLQTPPSYPPFNFHNFNYGSQQHLINSQFQLSHNFYGNGTSGIVLPSLLSSPYGHATSSSTSSSLPSGQSWNSMDNILPHNLQFFPSLMVASHHPHLLMQSSQHSDPSLWSHSLLPANYVDQRNSERTFPASNLLRSLTAPYGMNYYSGRGVNPLLNMGSKRKGGQIRFSNSQTAQLEKSFFEHKYQNAHDRKKLAHSLGLTDRQVKTWFQNRRAKWRKVDVKKDGIDQNKGPQSSYSDLQFSMNQSTDEESSRDCVHHTSISN